MTRKNEIDRRTAMKAAVAAVVVPILPGPEVVKPERFILLPSGHKLKLKPGIVHGPAGRDWVRNTTDYPWIVPCSFIAKDPSH